MELKLHGSDLTMLLLYSMAQLACIYGGCSKEIKNLHQQNTTHHTCSTCLDTQANNNKPKLQNKQTKKPNQLKFWKHSSMMLTTDLFHTNRSFPFCQESIIWSMLFVCGSQRLMLGLSSSIAFQPYFLRQCLSLNLMTLLSKLAGQ